MEYQPLDIARNEIRLLTISRVSAKGGSSQQVHCRLEHVSLDDSKPGCGAYRTKSKDSADTYYPQPKNWRKGRDLWLLVLLPVAAYLIYLFVRFRVSRMPYRSLRFLLHFFNSFCINYEFNKVPRRAALLRHPMDHVYLLRIITDWAQVASFLSHYSLWPTVAMVIVGLFSLAVMFTPENRQRVLTKISEIATKQECYALALQAAHYGTVPDQTGFRFGWGDYVALSYCWGDQDPATMREIVVNGNAIKVGKNLEAALRVLPGSAEVSSGLKLWVDSLCINQNDLEERSQQVKCMRDIYARAWTVVVWLGIADNESNKAMDLITLLSLRSRAIRDPVQPKSPLRRYPDYFGRRELNALFHLLRRPYWKRLWIIQELAMGDNSVPILCGNRKVLWWQLHDVASTLEAAQRNLAGDFEKLLGKEKSSELSDLLWLICQLHQMSPHCSETADFDQVDRVVCLAQEAIATDPRDKVYGVLGLLPNAISSQITPDYSLTVLQIYTDFAKSVIEATGNLKVILAGSRRGLNEIWPSWVPDLSPRLDSRHVLLGFKEPYRASGDSIAKVQFSSDDRQLICDGFKIATVPSRNPKPPATKSPPLFQRKYHPVDVEAGIIRILAQTPFWKIDSLSERPEPGAYDLFLQGLLPRTLKRTPEREGEGAILQIMMAFYLIVETIRSRPLITFVGGHGIFASHVVEPGDEICILFGCNYPVILRPQGGIFRVVGECYIYDLKEGEALGWLDQGKCQRQAFTLC